MTRTSLPLSILTRIRPTDNSGVYQNVLDGHTGSWWFASGWCCANPSLPWGGGFSAPQGQSVTFSNTLGSDGQTWTSTIAELGSSTPVTNDFNLGNWPLVMFAMREQTSMELTRRRRQIHEPSRVRDRARRTDLGFRTATVRQCSYCTSAVLRLALCAQAAPFTATSSY